MEYKILGQYSTDGELIKFVKPVLVVQFFDTLRDEDGMVWAVLDEYGDWVSPTMKEKGLKSMMELEDNG